MKPLMRRRKQGVERAAVWAEGMLVRRERLKACVLSR